ncbi:hypothetical protein HQ545_05910 [Candidatus Woesearchaeota archaeon]|nr:hypothetical protein [Candidatus Woesearchaeota archaeon]
MDLQILKERDTPLLSRKRYTFEMVFSGATPSRLVIRDEIAKKVKSEPVLTIIKHVYNKYGSEKAKVIAHVYSKKEDMERLEDKVLVDKHKKPEPKKEE